MSFVSRTVGVLVPLTALLLACGGAPAPVEASGEETPAPGKRRADLADDCAEIAGQPPPEPLAKVYEGVAAKARCQREVYTIMGGLTHFLGVACEHCHVKDQYEKPTHNKAVANWMARELIPSLEKKTAGELWCNDCHVVNGKGTAKILGNPRKESWAIEWMTAHLTDDFQRSVDHGTLRCKDCHGANLGSPDFRRKIILTDHLPPRPTPPAPESPPSLESPESPESPPSPPSPPEANTDAGAP